MPLNSVSFKGQLHIYIFTSQPVDSILSQLILLSFLIESYIIFKNNNFASSLIRPYFFL